MKKLALLLALLLVSGIAYAQPYTITVNVVGEGSVTLEPDQVTYDFGTEVIITATAGPCWLFAAWSGDLTGSVNPDTFTVEGDLVITATFETNYCTYEGDPAFYVDFGEDTRDMIAGETYCWTVAPTNFGFVSAICPDTDTFCVRAWDTAGWPITGDPPLEACFLLDAGYLWWQDVCLTVPCTALPCDYDTLYIQMHCCNELIECCVDLPETCEDPNWYGGNPYYSTDQVIIHIVPSPPALYIEQDSVYYVEQGQTAAYVPFTICNGDACADPTVYDYKISCTPIVNDICTPSGFPQAGSTLPIDGGECDDVYGVVNAGGATVGDLADLQIIAWDQLTGTVYDTCNQLVEIVEPIPVPLFTTPVVTILVLAMILAAAVIMRRRAVSRA
jgi:hypothetical protein